MVIRFLFFLTLLWSLTSSTLNGWSEERSLYWSDFSVQAYLDGDGRLHIKEKQTIVFNGSWNGGERTFHIRKGQSFRLNGIYRVAPDGEQYLLQKGHISKVDNYTWHDRKTLRWRNRLPADPPFVNEAITYILDYSLAKIIASTAEGKYLLSHDFAFAQRTGIIKTFHLELALDEQWNQNGFPLTINQADIQPGESIVVTKTLDHLLTGPSLLYKTPSRISRRMHLATAQAAWWLSLSCGILLTLLFVYCSVSFLLHESRNGRFKPLPDLTDIDHAWLEEHVFSLLPETVGATWDKKTSGHEVAAVLARLVVEEKMASRLEQVTIPILGWRVPGNFTLYLDLLKSRESFTGYERELIDGFFIDGDTTDSKKIRAHYRKKRQSFLPASKIKEPLEKRVGQLTLALKNPLEYHWLIPLAGLSVAFLIILANAFLHQDEMLFTILGGTSGLMGCVVGSANGKTYRSRSDMIKWRILLVHLFPVLLLIVFIALYIFGVSSLLTCGISILFSSAIYTIFYSSKTRDSSEGVQLCQKLAGARSFFQQELKKKQPAIRDEWFPYLLAFGLGHAVDSWSKQFPRADVPHHFPGHGTTGGSTNFTGGGGSFGGGGASGSWAAAATSLGSSTTSSSGGSSGGGSSGGGGGGGF